MKLIINKIAITGFKGYKDTVEYNLGNRTTISGDNRLGKSSVGEAIVWALTGCNLWGNEKATNDLVNNTKPKLTEVVLDFLLDEEPQQIIRRKKGATNEVYFNEKKSSTNELSQEIFKNKNVFLSIFNPYYFPELTPKDAKQLLSDVLKPANREEIFKELGDYLKQILLDNGFRLPETFLADTRGTLKENEDNIIWLEGGLDKLQPIDIYEKKVFDDTELNALKIQLEELRNQGNTEVELAKLIKPTESIKALSELREQEFEIKATLNNLDLQELLPIADKKARKGYLLDQYKVLKNKLDTMESKIIKCDSCGNEIDLTKEAKESLKAEIQEIRSNGTKLKDEIEDLENRNKAISESNEKIRDTKATEVTEKLKAIEGKKQIVINNDEKTQKEYEEKRQAIIDGNAVKQAENEEKIQIVKVKISEFETQEREINNYNSQIDAAIMQNEKIAKNTEITKERIQNSKNKIEQLKLALDTGKQYNSIKLKKQTAEISKYLNRVTIQFEKITKDGELKDDFKVLLDGKEFSKLSGSEKITAGLEIGNLLMNIQNLHFPIFVDDGERINVIPELDTQMIVTKVTKDKEIKVEVQE